MEQITLDQVNKNILILTKEIEDDNEIPLEEKAIMQSKINRGKSLNSQL